MNEMRGEYIRAVVAETLAEQQRRRHDDIDAVVLKAVATILTSFGMEEKDRQELRADFQHLRRWRKSVEQAQSYTFKAVITIIVTGVVGQSGSASRSCSGNDLRHPGCENSDVVSRTHHSCWAAKRPVVRGSRATPDPQAASTLTPWFGLYRIRVRC